MFEFFFEIILSINEIVNLNRNFDIRKIENFNQRTAKLPGDDRTMDRNFQRVNWTKSDENCRRICCLNHNSIVVSSTVMSTQRSGASSADGSSTTARDWYSRSVSQSDRKTLQFAVGYGRCVVARKRRRRLKKPPNATMSRRRPTACDSFPIKCGECEAICNGARRDLTTMVARGRFFPLRFGFKNGTSVSRRATESKLPGDGGRRRRASSMTLRLGDVNRNHPASSAAAAAAAAELVASTADHRRPTARQL